jgi:two-component system, NarL family, sensor histidine kinase FusK
VETNGSACIARYRAAAPPASRPLPVPRLVGGSAANPAGGRFERVADTPIGGWRVRERAVESGAVTLPERYSRVGRAVAAVRDSARLELSEIILAVMVAVVYFAAAKFGLSMAFATKQVTAVWPPTGIALAALLLFGWRLWPGVFVGALVANLTASEATATALGIAIGNTAAALIGWYLLRRFAEFDDAVRRTRDVGVLVLVAASTPLLSATNGVATLAVHGVVGWGAFWEVWRTWWVGDALGILLVCPVLLTWARRSRPVAPSKPVELTVLVLSCLCVSVVVLSGAVFGPGSHYQLQYAVFPFIIWAALRWGPRETSAIVLGVSAVAIWGASHGGGPFAAGSIDERLVLLDLFMAVAGLTGLALSAATAERRHVQTRLQDSEQRRQSLVAAILHAEEEARQRVAVELHDDTIQVLIAALLDLDRCAHAVDSQDGERARARIRSVRHTLNDALNRLRRLTFELRPPLLEAQGVGVAVGQMLDGLTDDVGIQIERRIELRRYAPEIEILVFQTTRELIANVRKHAYAAHVEVSLIERDRVIQATVRDNGRGFDVAAAFDRTKTRYNPDSMPPSNGCASSGAHWLSIQARPAPPQSSRSLCTAPPTLVHMQVDTRRTPLNSTRRVRPCGRSRTRAAVEMLAGGSGLLVWCADRFALRRSSLPQVDAERGHRADGQEFGLPVLERPVPEFGFVQIGRPGDGRLTVGALVSVEAPPPVQEVREPRQEEDRGHGDHERVGVDGGAPPTHAGPAGRVGVRVASDALLLVVFAARFAFLF